MKKRNDERIEKLKQENSLRDFADKMFSANSFFFSGGEFPAEVRECMNSGLKIPGMRNYREAAGWFNNTFTSVWRKIHNGRPVDLNRKLNTLLRRYMVIMKPVFEGVFSDSVSDKVCLAAWKEFSEAQDFYFDVKKKLKL